MKRESIKGKARESARVSKKTERKGEGYTGVECFFVWRDVWGQMAGRMLLCDQESMPSLVNVAFKKKPSVVNAVLVLQVCYESLPLLLADGYQLKHSGAWGEAWVYM